MLLQELDCYLLDYNGYIVLSENPEEVLSVLNTLLCVMHLFFHYAFRVFWTNFIKYLWNFHWMAFAISNV